CSPTAPAASSSNPSPLMPEPRDVHRASAMVLSAAMVVIGIAMLAVTLGNGGGPLALGTVLGILFVVAGGGRLWVTWRGV
ncbi:MAG: hypothetical protein ACRDMZ_05045, partial [Solirubrobacteraceae bacterium]